MNKPLCSIIILSYNQWEYTKQCLESIALYTGDVSCEIIIIDNGSDQQTVSCLKQEQGIRLILNCDNLGFAGGCNQGIGLARGKYIMLLNNDTVVTQKWLSNMVRLLEQRPDIDMTGPLTNATVGKQMIPVPYDRDDLNSMQRFASAVAAGNAPPWRTLRLVAFCVLIRRTLFDEIGLFDTGFKVGNYEDDDFNIRALLAGKKAYICRNSFVHHFMNISFRGKSIQREKIMYANKLYLEKKWDQLDWNHHAVCNRYMLEETLKHGRGRLLHIGCGLGALEIELEDRGGGWRIEGMECHPVRAKIASGFLDKLHPYSIDVLQNLQRRFDVIIVECTLEKWGLPLLEMLKGLLKEDGALLLRVFNARHITVIEKAVAGAVEGNLLCAVSPGFRYYFDRSLTGILVDIGYRVIEIQEVRKSLSSLQEGLFEAVRDYMPDQEEAKVYNRIYKACVR